MIDTGEYELEGYTGANVYGDDYGGVAINTGSDVINLRKNDVIIIARYLKLTANDLKDTEA